MDSEADKNRRAEVRSRFGENLRRLRRRALLSQDELAVRGGLHRTEIGLIERGQRLVRIDTLIKLSGALEVSADELLEGISWVAGESRSGSFAFGEPPRYFRFR